MTHTKCILFGSNEPILGTHSLGLLICCEDNKDILGWNSKPSITVEYPRKQLAGSLVYPSIAKHGDITFVL